MSDDEVGTLKSRFQFLEDTFAFEIDALADWKLVCRENVSVVLGFDLLDLLCVHGGLDHR